MYFSAPSVQVLLDQVDKLKKLNRVLEAGSAKDQSYILQLNHDLRKLQEDYKKVKSQKNELENSHHRAMKEITHNNKDLIIVTLKDDVARLKEELDERDKRIADLEETIGEYRTKLSEEVSAKFTDNNPAIADLSDSRRPQKLVETFSNMYDNKWTDAFEQSESIGSDKEICKYLLQIFKSCWDFCKETSVIQLKQLESLLMMSESQKDDDNTVYMSPKSWKSLKVLRKMSAGEMMPNMYKKFKSQCPDINKEMHPYLESCLEICWYGSINDPPLDFAFKADTHVDDFRAYIQSGKRLDFVVWPAMYLFENGPVLYKGVAQFSD